MVNRPETDSVSAQNVIDKMSNNLDCWSVEYEGKEIAYCITVGVAEYKPIEPVDVCINRADMELYEEKKKAKNLMNCD